MDILLQDFTDFGCIEGNLNVLLICSIVYFINYTNVAQKTSSLNNKSIFLH